MAATIHGIKAAFKASGCDGPIRLRHRADGHVFVTDQGHLILDAGLGAIPDARRLARELSGVPGVVEHGLFIGWLAGWFSQEAMASGSSSGLKVFYFTGE